jgi:hypothetical protein
MPCLATILITLSLTVPAMSGRAVSLPRRGQGWGHVGIRLWGWRTEFSQRRNERKSEKAAEIAADFMTAFYHVQVGALETQEFRTTPVPFWLICFSDSIKGPIKNMFFVVLLPDGTVVVPKVAERQ